MKKNILTYLIAPLLATALFAACTNDYDLPASPADDAEGRLIVNYSCTGLQTRATTEPWGAPWYEMKIRHLDLFLFDDDGNLLDHYGDDYDGGRSEDFPVPTTELTAKQVTDLDPATCYLIANCPSVASIQSLSDLQNAVINPTNGDPELIYNQKHDRFVMTGMITKEDIVHGSGHNGKDVTMNFQLKRVAAKIVLQINGGTLQDGMSYRMFNYATKAHVLPRANEDGYQLNEDWLGTTPTMTLLPTNANNNNKENNIHLEGSMKEVVFYSYPTDWFDTSTVTKNADGTYTIENMYTEPPIVENKECYILIEAPYNGQKYRYKIPVNWRLPDYNDKKTLTETEYQEVRDLYRLKSNHVYQITVTIRIAGGVIDDPQQPDRLLIKVDDWNSTETEEHNVNINDFK